MRRLVYTFLVLIFAAAACSPAVTTKRKRKNKKKPRTLHANTNVPKPYKKRKSQCQLYEPLIRETAKKYKLEPELVMGVVKVESGFNPGVKSRVGARGLMQVMPKTGKYMKCGSDLHDPEENIECGCKVLRKYTDRYKGNLVYGLSAYNAGPGNTNPSNRLSELPFNFRYVEKVLRWRNVFVRFGCR
jgi:soluble lytic murein transglycosylase-like protein